MERLEGKMTELVSLLKEQEIDLTRDRKGKPLLCNVAQGNPYKRNSSPEILEKKIADTKLNIEKVNVNMRIKDDLKKTELGTLKFN